MTTGQAELVSVITPCYNAAPFVAETIEAVAAQRYAAGVEHIVVDDGSTDGSWSAIERFGERVRAVRLPENRGGSHARNQGAALAGGAYLMFLDADDVISPQTVGALVEAIRERPGAIGACPWRRLRQAAGGEWVEAPAEIPFPLPEDALRAWMEGCWVPPCAILWRRDTYERTGGWDERITLNDDGDLMMRALAGGARIVPTTGGKALYRYHGEARVSLSQDVFSPKRLRSMCLVWENLAAALERHGKLSAWKEAVGLKFYSMALACFQQGQRESGRRCLEAAERLAGRRVVARTWPGWLLTWLLGYEGKERVVDTLAALGIMTPTRRRSRALRRGHARGEPPSGDGPPCMPAMRVWAWPADAAENPYTSLLYESLGALGVEVVGFTPVRLLRRPATIWHLHWVECMWNRPSLVRAACRAVAILGMLQLARCRGTKIVWTVHNLHTHEQFHPRLERWFWTGFLRRLDGYLALSSVGKAMAQEHFPALRTLPGFVVPHGHYRDAYPATVTRDGARARLGIPPDASVVAFLGKVRPYKNVPHLVRTFRALPDPALRLLIAGEPNLPGLEDEIRGAADGDPRIQLCLKHIPHDEVQIYLHAADLVVLPYRDILNSGSALLALSFDRPVLVPDRGAMGELAERVGPEWVRTFTDALSPAALEEAVRRADGRRGQVCEGVGALSWPHLAAETLDAFERVRQGAGSAGEPEAGLASGTVG